MCSALRCLFFCDEHENLKRIHNSNKTCVALKNFSELSRSMFNGIIESALK